MTSSNYSDYPWTVSKRGRAEKHIGRRSMPILAGANAQTHTSAFNNQMPSRRCQINSPGQNGRVVNAIERGHPADFVQQRWQQPGVVFAGVKNGKDGSRKTVRKSRNNRL